MKQLLAAIVRFLLAIPGIAALVLVLRALSLSGNGSVPSGSVLLFIKSEICMTVPAGIVVSMVLVFYHINRTFRQRPLGYLFLFICSGLGLFLALFGLSAFGLVVPTGPYAPFPDAYMKVAQWYLSLTSVSLLERAVSCGAFGLAIASFWAVSRFTRARPVFGAFFAPLIVAVVFIAVSFALNSDLPGLARIVGLRLNRNMALAAACFAISIVLILADFLFFAKPGAERL